MGEFEDLGMLLGSRFHMMGRLLALIGALRDASPDHGIYQDS